MPLAELGASFLFQVTTDRAERAAVLLTTNLPFSEWTQVIPNARLCKSLLGRCVLVRIHSSDLTLPVRTQPGSRLRACCSVSRLVGIAQWRLFPIRLSDVRLIQSSQG